MRKTTKFLLLRTSIIVAFALLSGRLWYVQVVMGSYYRQQADTSKIRHEPVAAMRGIVYDRAGRQLVWNSATWRVLIVPHAVPARPGAMYRQLSHLLHGKPSPSQIASAVNAGRWRPYAPTPLPGHISADTAMVIKQLHTQLPGVRAEPSSIREYRRDSQLSLPHILGYTGEITREEYATDRRFYPAEHFGTSDQIGRDGIEYSMNPYLHGVNATDEVEVDAGERPIRVLRHGVSVAGDSIYLTINTKLQSQIGQDLGAALRQLGLRQGAAIVEDVHTGQILAMVSLPGFDNNWFSGGISAKRYASLVTDAAHPLTNLATQGRLPPGSTYKIITAVAALQTGVTTATRIINDTGVIKLPCAWNSKIVCQPFEGWNPNGLGPMDVVSALAESSDIYFYTVAGGNPTISPSMPYVGGERLASFARQMGLGQTTGIELPGEAQGLIPSPSWFARQSFPYRRPGEQWHIGQTYNMAIGQGFNEVTPLQMANVAATIANGGVLYRPRIVERIEGRVAPRQGVLQHSQVIQPFVPSVLNQGFIDPYNLSLIQTGMHHSVDWGYPNGTSFNVTDKRIDAAGKTGTAEDKPLPPHAWWIGYAPFNHPKIAVAVVVPNAGGEGAYVAAPIAHKIFEDYFHQPPSKPNWLIDVQRRLATFSSGAVQ